MRPRRRIGVLDVLFAWNGTWLERRAIHESIEDDYRRQQREAAKEAALLEWVRTRRDAA